MKHSLRKSIFTVLLMALCLISGCKKNNEKATLTLVFATIFYSGPVAVDGCDWIVRVNGISYHPENLDDKYKVDNSNVNVSFNVLSQKFSCGWPPSTPENPGMNIIHINKIETIN